MTFTLPAHFLNSPVRVAVVGAGGSGSHTINALVQMHLALVALGHRHGFDVTVIDDDTVSESNVGRQAFVSSDIGQPKARVLVNRLNAAFGLAWRAKVERVAVGEIDRLTDIVIGCVDNRAARHAILNSFSNGTLWLDLGNGVNDGQVVLGEIGVERSVLGLGNQVRPRLPTVADLFPEIVDPALDPLDDQPSCSMAEALEKQGLFVNRAMALHGLNLLWTLFRSGSIAHHGVFVNLATGRSAPLTIDPATWARFGYVIEEKAAA